ncbi:MAG TPA: hypothetical protein VJV78_48795, partial [Polyangiales bacterium]|nr:hypothetical protein [Polyangiales bacterium]
MYPRFWTTGLLSCVLALQGCASSEPSHAAAGAGGGPAEAGAAAGSGGASGASGAVAGSGPAGRGGVPAADGGSGGR